MEKKDIYKKVDTLINRLKKEAGKYGEECFPMKAEVSFKEWKGKRWYISLDLTDRCGTHRKYECGYIEISTGKYSSKCKASYSGTLSLVRPDYELLKFDFNFLPPPQDFVRKEKEKIMLLCEEEEQALAKKEGRHPRRVVDFVDGKAVYEERR